MHSIVWVSLDGTDGVGKSTLLNGLIGLLRGRFPGYRVEALPEFSTTGVGSLIRNVINERYFFQLGDDGFLPIGETLVLAADLSLQLEVLTRQQRDRPVIVVSDRGPLSLVVYQMIRIARYTPGVDAKFAAEWIQHILSAIPTPELTIVLRVPERELEQRLRKREPNLAASDLEFVFGAQRLFLAKVEEGRNRSLPMVVFDNTRKNQAAVANEIAAMIARLV